MKPLNIYPVSGLFYELYNPQVGDFNTTPLISASDNPLRRTNALFWARLFSIDSLIALTKAMNDACYLKQRLSIQEKAVLADPDFFVRLAHQAPLKILDQGLSPQEFFKWLEVLTIACRFFSEYICCPFEITVQDGFLLPDFSTDKMFDIALDASKNPYLPFLAENVFPVIDEYRCDFVWVNGQLKTSAISIAAYIKRKYPKCFIAIRNHSSEYYSLNKIESLLKNNKLLFSLIDCIVLDDNQATYQKVENMVSDGSCNLSEINNIIYIDRDKKEISISGKKRTAVNFNQCISTRDECDDLGYSIPPNRVVNLRLNPNTQCFWKKCSFCGINEKYSFILDKELDEMSYKCQKIKELATRGANYFWFEDEAVAPELLSQFADNIIASGLKFEWQVRSRFHPDFTVDLCKKLYTAGLREIRFGLESACGRILKSMNKFDADVNLEFVEKMVARFVTEGVHVHFPMIVGYPTETQEERSQTYEFLNKMQDRYTYFSFNVNVLMLDVSSALFKNFPHYDISSISYPCVPSSFLGNMVAFDCADSGYSYADIDEERILFMANSLYDWMPTTALTKSHIFYRLSETIRNTLTWSVHERLSQKTTTSSHFVKNPNVSYWREADYWYIYDWSTHNIISCTHDDFQFWNCIETVATDDIALSERLQEIKKLNLLVAGMEDGHHDGFY